MPPIAVGVLVAVDYFEDASDGTEEKMPEINKSFIFNEGRFGYFKKIEDKSRGKNNFKWPVILY